jgi:hypothetical protein
MIFYLMTADHAAPIESYLNGLGAPMAARITPLTYEKFLAVEDAVPGTYCFANLESLSDDQRARATARWEELTAMGCHALNHPTESMQRFELLRTLHDDGINRFTIHRLDDREHCRYPVFLRRASDHDGSRSPLLDDRRQLDDAIVAVEASGEPLEDYVVVEFCDTADARGVYRKYGALLVGDVVVARHLQASRDWQVKDNGILSRKALADEREYVATNPHAERVRELFARARISYGRIDYSIVDGSFQVWEINTNPTIAFLPRSNALTARARRGVRWFRSSRHRHSLRRGRRRAPTHRLFADNLAAAWTTLERADD